MNARDIKRFQTIKHQADTLLNAGVTGSGITNMDVMEAVLGDMQAAMGNRDPRELAKLIELDKAV